MVVKVRRYFVVDKKQHEVVVLLKVTSAIKEDKTNQNNKALNRARFQKPVHRFAPVQPDNTAKRAAAKESTLDHHEPTEGTEEKP